nr:MAG TPA: hypothetical protein [Caudoviricetes sp.]
MCLPYHLLLSLFLFCLQSYVTILFNYCQHFIKQKLNFLLQNANI